MIIIINSDTCFCCKFPFSNKNQSAFSGRKCDCGTQLQWSNSWIFSDKVSIIDFKWERLTEALTFVRLQGESV